MCIRDRLNDLEGQLEGLTGLQQQNEIKIETQRSKLEALKIEISQKSNEIVY